MGEKDTTTKTLESYNSVFADIVNCLLFDGKSVIDENNLTPADKESQYKADGKIRSQERDVSKFWMNTNINIAFIGIENQVAPDELMPIRIMNYDSAVYREQYTLKKNNKLKKCYPVITLVIYFGKDDWNYGKNLLSCIDVPPVLLPYVNNYRMNFYSVKDMTEKQINLFKSDFKVIAEFFSALNNGTDYRPSNQVLEYPEEVIDMISVFSGDDRFRDDYNALIGESEGGITMCEIYDKILQEGRAEGRAEGRLAALADLVKSGIIKLEQAAEQAKMPIEEFKTKTGLSV